VVGALHRAPLALLMACASLALASEANGTCMRRCEARLVDASCNAKPGNPWPAGLPLRVWTLCTDFCSAPGGPVNRREHGPSAEELAGIEVWRKGCSAPEPLRWTVTEQACGQATLALADRSVGPGTYEIRRVSEIGEVVVLGAKEADCPSEEAYRDRLAQEQLERERQEQRERLEAEEQGREQQERLRREWQARIAEQQRQCRPPNGWNAWKRACLAPPPPASAAPPAPPARSSPAPGFWEDGDWEDGRDEWGWTLSLGATARLLRRDRDDNAEEKIRRGLVGGTIAAGFRHFSDYRGESMLEAGLGGDSTVQGLVWCAPVGCGIGGLLIMPLEAFVGNEHGLDVRGHFARDYREETDGFTGGVSFRPILRVSRDSRFSTGTFFGGLLPEVGLQFPTDQATELFFSWSYFPIDLRIGHYLALSWDGVTVGPTVPLDGDGVWVSIGTGLSFNLLSVSD